MEQEVVFLKITKMVKTRPCNQGQELMQSGMILSLRVPAEAFGFLKGGAGSGAGLFQ